jgi:hypothetical protein
VFGRGKADKDRYARPRRKSDHASSSGKTRSRAGDDRVTSAPAPPPPTGPTSSPPRPSRQQTEAFAQAVRNSQRSVGLAIVVRLAIVAVVIGAVVVPLINTGSTIPSFSIPTPVPTVPGSFGTKTGPGKAGQKSPKPVSYLTVGGVRAGLARVAKRLPGARLALVRLSASSLIASAGLRGGGFRQIVLGPTGTLIGPGASSGERLIPLSQITPQAVRRIVTGMRARFHVPPAKIDYMVLSSPPGAATRWIIFSKAPGHPGFSASLTGAGLTRLPG